MKKINFNFEKLSKKNYLIIGGIILLLIIIVISILLIFNKKEVNEEEKLTQELKSLGIEFYEDFYYRQIGTTDDERKEFLEKYKDIGIKVSLDNLARYKTDETDDILAKFVNSKTNEECDKTSSMVIIYPKESYSKTDYTIDAILSCGFEEEETE